MWKMFSDYSEPTRITPSTFPSPRKEGNIVVSVGTKRKTHSIVEKSYSLDDELLGYNLGFNKVLMKVKENNSDFDVYVGLPFTKGVTERETRRTLLILGSGLHHIQAMQNQFDDVVWTKKDLDEARKYGNTLRWINVGDTKTGFIGLDYNPLAKQTDGVASSKKDITFLAQTLLEYGYDKNKRLFLLNPPYIVEQEEGKKLRKSGLEKLFDWAKLT